MQVLCVALQIDDRVANKLAWPMERHVAATFDFMQLHAGRREQCRRREKVLIL